MLVRSDPEWRTNKSVAFDVSILHKILSTRGNYVNTCTQTTVSHYCHRQGRWWELMKSQQDKTNKKQTIWKRCIWRDWWTGRLRQIDRKTRERGRKDPLFIPTTMKVKTMWEEEERWEKKKRRKGRRGRKKQAPPVRAYKTEGRDKMKKKKEEGRERRGADELTSW